MLPGGLSVLGVHLYASQDMIFSKSSAPTLQKLLKKLAATVSCPDRLFVLNLCSKSRKCVVRQESLRSRVYQLGDGIIGNKVRCLGLGGDSR